MAFRVLPQAPVSRRVRQVGFNGVESLGALRFGVRVHPGAGVQIEGVLADPGQQGGRGCCPPGGTVVEGSRRSAGPARCRGFDAAVGGEMPGGQVVAVAGDGDRGGDDVFQICEPGHVAWIAGRLPARQSPG